MNEHYCPVSAAKLDVCGGTAMIALICALAALGFWCCCRMGDIDDRRNGWK